MQIEVENRIPRGFNRAEAAGTDDVTLQVPSISERELPACRIDRWFTCGRVLLLLFGLLFVLYPEVILGSHTFFYRDFGLFGYPIAHHLRESFWRGELPLWNPLGECGVPFAAQWAPMVFYPGSLFYILLPLRWSLGFFSLAHLLLAGASMYALTHRWTGNRIAASFAALTFAANGMLLHSLMWPHYMAAFAWMPLVVLWTERAVCEGNRAVLVAALVGAVQMLTGAPEPIVLTWLVALGWTAPVCSRTVAAKKLVLRFGAVAGLIVALTAVELFPFVDLLLHSRRDTAFGDSAWSMPLWGIANYLVPLFHTTPARIGVYTQDSQQLFSSYYAGIGTAALAMWTIIRVRDRRVRLLALTACVGLVFALGERGIVYGLLKQIFPPLGFSRYPVKWLILVTFALPLLAARGIAHWNEDNQTGIRREIRSLIFLGAFLLTVVAAIALVALRAPVANEIPSITLNNAATRTVLLAATIAALILCVKSSSSVQRAVLAAALLIITACDLVSHTPRQNPPVSIQAYEPAEIKVPARPQPGESRAIVSREMHNFLQHGRLDDSLNYYLSLRRAAFENCNLIDGVPKVNGFWPLSLREYSEVADLIYKNTNALPQGLADFLGASIISSPTVLCAWDSRPSALPLITGGQKPIFAGREETLRSLASSGFDPRRIVYLNPEERDGTSIGSNSAVQITSGAQTAHEWNFTATATAPGLVVISQPFYHPWEARVDGRPQRLLRANHAFQALQIGAGSHVVQLRYADWAFRIGATLSITALLSLLFFFWRCSPQPSTALA